MIRFILEKCNGKKIKEIIKISEGINIRFEDDTMIEITGSDVNITYEDKHIHFSFDNY